jgi:hypothetical protein
VNLSKMTFTADTGGPIQCDSSSFMWTDVTHANAKCGVPSAPQAAAPHAASHTVPDLTAIRIRQANYRRLAGASPAEGKESQP